jgi:hypothetical protein
MSEKGDEKGRGFDMFEFLVAFLLGLGAVGGAWAAYQADLCDGNSVEAYGRASTESTRASTIFNTAISGLLRDMSLDVDAKQQIFEAAHSTDEATATRGLDVARWIYTTQVTEPAYTALHLDPQYRETAQAEVVRYREMLARGENPFEAAENAEEEPEIPVDALISTLFYDISEDEAYLNATLADGIAAFEEADKSFQEGQKANETGDKFALDGVLFTVALFLAGISLVFRSWVKWIFFMLAVGSFGGASVYLGLVHLLG